ncbi:hypothetical protein EOE67_18195 [Rheinheimera riviphila]|uniref:DUF6436 domain-containing protein n=1 Tax=Rheinheimera riviphila TaxID=1834037 RepID=A0A437QET5_9GAMM|nr:DUF6436 domain-containing protein [Rheinheimera riviphila]RVU33088.1 hypothetical protein EOE67_18195 [Rheinheimera riviphila]
MKLSSLRIGWALLLLWLLASSVLLFRLGQTDVGEFDPQLQLQQHPQQLAALLRLSGAGSGETLLLNVLDPNCRCAALAENHLQQLQPTLTKLPKLRQLAFNPTQLQQAGIAVPATPMMIVLRNKQLIYSGPYASGPACSIGESLLDQVLQQKLQTPASWLNSETVTCRCLRS